MLSGHQPRIGAACYSCANDEHLFPVPMPSFTDAQESCDLDGVSYGNNTAAVGKVFMHQFRLSFTDIKTSLFLTKKDRSAAAVYPSRLLSVSCRVLGILTVELSAFSQMYWN